MSKNYSAVGVTASGSSAKTALNLRSTAALRVGIFFVDQSILTVPNATDFQVLGGVTRSTAQGTSAASAPTPLAIDGGDIASLVVVEWTNSAEPTYAASDLLQLGMNQRGARQFNAYDGREIWSVAGAATGIGHRLVSTAAATSCQMNSTINWRE